MKSTGTQLRKFNDFAVTTWNGLIVITLKSRPWDTSYNDAVVGFRCAI